MSKLILYCVKSKPYLYKTEKPMIEKKFVDYHTQLNEAVLNENLNGKIVAECDFEVEKLTNCGTSFMIMKYDDLQESYRYTNKVARGSCLDYTDLKSYLGNKDGYAIHIKNLHIFDKPKELNDYTYFRTKLFGTLGNAPQNMMYAYEVVPCKEEHLFRGVLQEFRWNRCNKCILISIKPEWLCKILNGEKTIEIRKKVLKEMLG